MVNKKIKEFAKVRRGASPRPITDPKYFGGNVGWVRIADVSASNKYLRKTTQYVSPLGESLSVRVDKGDLIMSIAGTVGRPMIVDMPACIHDGFVHIYDFSNANNEYLYYYLQFFEENIKSLGQSGTQTNLNTSIVGEIDIFFPELKEQSIIATILSTIDQAIEKTERLIAKYECIKTGLMQDLLTRGIDEQGRIRSEETHTFKDSALGRIPVEWEVATLKTVCERIQDGTHFSPEISDVGEFMYITSKNIRMGELELGNVEYITREAHESIYRRCSVEYGDILLTKDGANTGNVSLNTIKEPISLLSSVAFLRGKKGYLKNDFLFQVLASEKLQKTFKDQMSGNAITRTTLTKINATLIAVPKIDEQERTISVLGKFDSNLSKEKVNLMKYQSMKTALMQDLLTGRIRVENKCIQIH